MQVFINLLPNENAPLRPVESVIPASCPEDSPINHLSNMTEASGKLIKVVAAADADWLVEDLTDVNPKGAKTFHVCPQ